MGIRWSRNQNHEDDDATSSSRKRIMTFENDSVPPWSDVNRDVLFLVMMQLGVVDFIAFSRVCKSWRSLALCNMETFMASKPPISIRHISRDNYDGWCHLEDFDKRKFKTIIPRLAGKICVGSTCGYLILFERVTRDFWLVNPITRHELHFPDYPFYVGRHGIGRDGARRLRGILVFSPSKSRWVLFMLYNKLSFYIEGKRGWNHVSSTVPILDLHFYKGKMYTLHTDCSLGELRLNLNHKRKWTLLETKTFPNPNLTRPRFVSSGENLYVTDAYLRPPKVLQLDFGEMKWGLPEKTIEEYAFFISWKNYSAAIKPESWLGHRPQYKSLGIDKSPRDGFYYEDTWYFLHDCLNVNLLNN